MNIQKQAQQGFTLIELMIVIAIVGILAAVALPAYQDYTVRAKMSEPMALLSEAKTTISEYYTANGGEWPADATAAGLSTDVETDIVASLAWGGATTQTLTVTLASSGLGSNVNGKQFMLSLKDTNGGSRLEWTCKPASGANSLAAKYLPANCRG